MIRDLLLGVTLWLVIVGTWAVVFGPMPQLAVGFLAVVFLVPPLVAALAGALTRLMRS